jgi:hypothetical protein
MKNLSPSSAKNPIDQTLAWYEKQPWLRALVQTVPVGGGTIDTLLAWRGTHLNQQRIDELLKNVSVRLANVEEEKLDRDSLESEEFFEVFRTCAEIAARTASKSKRERLADFLAGTMLHGLDDLSLQFAEDLKALQELHLYVMALFPCEKTYGVKKSYPREDRLQNLDKCAYEKVVSDLQRFGFLEYDDSEGMWDENEGGALFTTDYFRRFMGAMTI